MRSSLFFASAWAMWSPLAAVESFADMALDAASNLNVNLDNDGPRILELGDGMRGEYTFREMLALKKAGVNFFDVTELEDSASFKVASANAEVRSKQQKSKPSHRNSKQSKFPKKIEHSHDVKKIAKTLSKSNLESTLTEFSGFFTRYAKSQYGLDSSLWLHKQISTIAEESGRKDVTVELFDNTWQQKSLIARFKGTKNPDHIVVVGAHQDSINLVMPNFLPAPGADDDGSGSMTTREVFRALLEADFKPENTVEFHWYSGEEIGLLGSQAIFQNYSAANKDVKAMLQQDMTGYSATSKKNGHPDQLGVIVDYVDEGLTNFIKTVVDEYCDIEYVETKCGYACSDHASASKYGYPSAFVIESEFENSNKFIHTTQDTVDKLDFDHMLEHAKLTLGYAYELGFAKF